MTQERTIYANRDHMTLRLFSNKKEAKGKWHSDKMNGNAGSASSAIVWMERELYSLCKAAPGARDAPSIVVAGVPNRKR
jgi:hypothetical protein